MTKLEFVAENGNIRIDKYIADNEPVTHKNCGCQTY